MLPAEQAPEISVTERIRKKPVICNIILAMALTYFLILFICFLIALIFSGDIADTISHYYTEEDFSASNLLWFTLVGTVLYFACTIGIILVMARRRFGFYLFVINALAIFILDFIFLDFDWLRYLILSGLIFLVGILHFSGRCYRRKVPKAGPAPS